MNKTLKRQMLTPVNVADITPGMCIYYIHCSNGRDFFRWFPRILEVQQVIADIDKYSVVLYMVYAVEVRDIGSYNKVVHLLGPEGLCQIALFPTEFMLAMVSD